MWTGRHVVVGVSGGIACYKSCDLVRRLSEAGALVDVVLTPSAMEFIRPVVFESLSGRPVLTSLWEPGRALAHVRLAERADLVIVAPATAHLLARAALGLADELLTSLLLARRGPVLFAPAMNDAMYAAPPTQQHVATLRQRGWALVGPEVGALAEGPAEEPGRMSEPATILAHAARLLSLGGPLAGKTVLVTAGPTREAIDPVRVVSNRSSGKMGYELARAAWARGAEVRLLTGPTQLPGPDGVQVRRVETTAELHRAVDEALPSSDVLLMAAAPADYRPVAERGSKQARQDGNHTVSLEPTEDILSATRSRRKAGGLIVGFALETGDGETKARAKLERKELDLIVLNDALEQGAGPEVDTNRVIVLDRHGRRTEIPLASKAEVAERILDLVEEELG